MITALRHCTWINEESFQKICIKEKGKIGGTHQPFYGTWVADFMLRQDAERFMLRKYLSDKKDPREVKETIVDGSGRNYAAGCRLCRIAREAQDESTAM